MNRFDKEVHDFSEIESILREGEMLYISLPVEDMLYTVPLQFGYAAGLLYICGTPQKRKPLILEQNDTVRFTCLSSFQMERGERPCEWSMSYSCVTGNGTARKVDEYEEKLNALRCIMKHGSKFRTMEFPMLHRTLIYCIHIAEITGKKSSW